MNKLLLTTILTISALAGNAQNLVTNQVFINTSNNRVSQQAVNYNPINNDINFNQSQTARNNIGNNRGNTIIQQSSNTKQTKTSNKSPLQAQVNIFDNHNNINENVAIQSNPPQVKTTKTEKKVTASVGLDFTPSGLSGRDYSNGGKIKKGEKNFYVQHSKKTPTRHLKKRPGGSKKTYTTHQCARWKA